jgi:hypothetical protein
MPFIVRLLLTLIALLVGAISALIAALTASKYSRPKSTVVTWSGTAFVAGVTLALAIENQLAG